MMNQNDDGLFDAILEYPSGLAQDRYHTLVGVENTKERLSKEAQILLRPQDLADWSQRKYGLVVPLTQVFKYRLPLFVFAGDIGTGKTSLAESFGDNIARDLKIAVTLYRLSLGARGTGTVGQMTALITSAFAKIEEASRKVATDGANPRGAIILLIDEADALAQSRELIQMHHEDRAGVNALIRGIDRIGSFGLPVLAVMCTNRLNALDPAVLRRAADVFEFRRPNLEQRTHVLGAALAEIGFDDEQIRILGELTGERNGRSYGCTYSDIVQRFLPEVLLAAFPESRVSYEKVRALAEAFAPTTPFRGDGV